MRNIYTKLMVCKTADEVVAEVVKKSHTAEEVIQARQYWLKNKPYLFGSCELIYAIFESYPEIRQIDIDSDFSFVQSACEFRLDRKVFTNIVSNHYYCLNTETTTDEGWSWHAVYPLDEASHSLNPWYLEELFHFGARKIHLSNCIEECLTKLNCDAEANLLFILKNLNNFIDESYLFSSSVCKLEDFLTLKLKNGRTYFEEIVLNDFNKAALAILHYAKGFEAIDQCEVNSIFHKVVSQNNSALALEMLKIFPINLNYTQPQMNTSPLSEAYLNANFYLAEKLIESGANIDYIQTNESFNTPRDVEIAVRKKLATSPVFGVIEHGFILPDLNEYTQGNLMKLCADIRKATYNNLDELLALIEQAKQIDSPQYKRAVMLLSKELKD